MKEVKIHHQENNQESQGHLEENEEKFSAQCIKLLKLFKGGLRLTVIGAQAHGIHSLPRRVLDLKESGVVVKDGWLRDGNGKRTVKEYWMELEKRPTKKATVEKWRSSFQQDLFGNKI